MRLTLPAFLLAAIHITTGYANSTGIQTNVAGPDPTERPSVTVSQIVRDDPGAARGHADLPSFLKSSKAPHALEQSAECRHRPAYETALMQNVLENFDRTETLRLTGPEWDNTLVRNCRIHDTAEDGVIIKNVRNVVVTNCEIWNTGGEGIKTSSSGSTENVTLDGNYIHDTASQGIHAPQRSAEGIDHRNLRILNNVIENTGSHAIYVQSQDFMIANNTIRGWRKGNGVTVRSSGTIKCNAISGASLNDKPAIRYYSDHQSGLSNALVIERNEITSDTIGIDLYPPRQRYDGQAPTDHVVKNFIVRYNRVTAIKPLRIHSDYDQREFSIRMYDNWLMAK